MTVHVDQATHRLGVQAMLGEGPIWDRDAGRLWFVDIAAPAVHAFDPAHDRHTTWPAPSSIGWVLPAAGGDCLVGLRNGLHRFSPERGDFTLLHGVEPELPNNRLNDAGVDGNGNVWFGTMDDLERSATGRVYRFDGRDVTDSGLPPMCITNGPAVSPDGRTLYVANTLARRVDAYAVTADGALGPGRLFLTVDPSDGYPDGLCCDAEGGVWVGLWGGWAARRYDAAGRLTDEIRFPVANVTKVALGGADGRTAFATTARKGLDDDALTAQPLAGDLFTFTARVPGVAAARVALPPSAEQYS
ncbi:MAG TPA: SMP-30/gluconolactonase/LRE family protein [Pseudomonadales bacterium]